MPSRKGMEQALTWLQSKMAGDDFLDAINAELCYNVITDIQKRKKAIGAMYHQTREQLKNAMAELEEACVTSESQKLYEAAVKALRRYNEATGGDHSP